MNVGNFRKLGSSVNIAATTTSASVALGVGCGSVRVYNNGTVLMWVEFGSSSGVTAVQGTSIPIPAGAVETLEVPSGTTHAGARTDSGTGTVHFTPGEGG